MTAQVPSEEPADQPVQPLVGCAGLDGLDVAGTLAAAEQAVVDRHAAEVIALEIDLHFAVLHSAEPVKPTGRPRTLAEAEAEAGRCRLIQLGGPGTPRVQDLPVCELGIARGIHTTAARHHLADALDLAHRLPRLWALLRAGRGQVWVARRITAMTRHLDQAAAAVVDTAVAAAVDESPGRLLAIAEAEIIRQDPDTAAAKAEARRGQRCFAINQSDEEGLRTVFARIDAGDAAWLDAMVDRIAETLADRPDLIEHPAGADATHDDLRVEAFTWLAHPDAVIALLRGTYPIQGPDTEGGDDGDADAGPATGGDESDHPTRPDGPRQPTTPGTLGTAGGPTPPDPTTPSPTRQKAVVHVHLAADAITGLLARAGVARIEELGPMITSELARLLRHARVDLKPVIDLNVQRSVNGYEHPADVKERGFLRTTGDVFPHAQTQSRRADADHPQPYDPNGPPGQTGDHNHAALGRHHHRAKTHAGYQVHQLALGHYLWRTPHGLWRLVDHTGTHRLTETEARALIGDARG